MYVDYPLNEITLKVVTETHLRHATVLPGVNDVFCLSASNLFNHSHRFYVTKCYCSGSLEAPNILSVQLSRTAHKVKISGINSS